MANMYGMVLARHHHFPDIKSKGTGVTCGWQHKMAVFKERCGGGVEGQDGGSFPIQSGLQIIS